MKLVIDIGNSRLKWATISAGKFTFGGSHAYKNQDYLTVLASIWQAIHPETVVIANVGGKEIAAAVENFAMQQWQCSVQFVKSELTGQGVKNGYATPLLLGADRWADVVAARAFCKTAFCVFDAGTSITADVVTAEGELVGGTISPGLNLMCDSLVSRAEGLKFLQGTFFQGDKTYPAYLEAKDTQSAIANGALLTAIAFLEQSAINLQKTYSPSMRFFVTGGDAVYLMPHLGKAFEYQPYLALQGVDILSH